MQKAPKFWISKCGNGRVALTFKDEPGHAIYFIEGGQTHSIKFQGWEDGNPVHAEVELHQYFSNDGWTGFLSKRETKSRPVEVVVAELGLVFVVDDGGERIGVARP